MARSAIIMNRFNRDAAHAFKVLRKMSQEIMTQMCVVAKQIINHNDRVQALRRLEEEAFDFGST
jgi:AmiR/NasT family two-component response regulator